MSDKILVSRPMLEKLVNCKLELLALQHGGVDNWEWYCEAFSNFIEDQFPDDVLDVETGFDILVGREIDKLEKLQHEV
ncbi:hypothetical protein [Pasteurella phage vB_PmuP_PS07]|nr:hypothetical protein [Pasteurella phage vB_PmuP_PS07]UIS74041.1 hypothetical protein [Pasteurella phage vB_PmuP_PS30]